MARKPAKKPSQAGKLNERQQLFAEFYAGKAKGNATLAAKMAGYKGNDAALASMGSALLRNPKVAEKLAELSGKVRTRAHATVGEVRAFLTSMMRDEPDLSEHELEFTVAGDAIVDPRKLAAVLKEHGHVPEGADIHFRRRTPKAVRISAALTLLKAAGALIDNVQLKVDGNFRTMFAGLQKYMPPESFAHLVDALGKYNSEVQAGK